MKNNIITYTIFSILFSCIVGFLSMVCAYSLPVEKIRENAKASLPLLIKEKEVYNWNRKLTGAKIDNFTTSIMLNNASFLGRGNIIYDAVMNPRIQYPNTNKIADLYLSTQEDTLNKNAIIDYPKYWHGYLTILKPTLLFFNLKEIRIINFIFQNILLIITLYLLTKRLNFKYALAFLVSTIYLNPISLGMCPHFHSTYYIMLISCICMLLSTNKNNHWKIFLFSGIATSFLDTLTSPLITLGFPLIIYTNLYPNTLYKDIKNIIKNSILWSTGYSLMWISKWILATIITKNNIIKDGLTSTIYRINGDGFSESGITNWTSSISILRNINEFYNTTNLLIFLIFLLILTSSYFIKKYNFIKNHNILTNLFIGLYPFIWYSIIINHSIVHPILAHRILTISILSICTSIVCILKDRK